MNPVLKVSLFLAAGIATSPVFAAPANTALPDSCAKGLMGILLSCHSLRMWSSMAAW